MDLEYMQRLVLMYLLFLLKSNSKWHKCWRQLKGQFGMQDIFGTSSSLSRFFIAEHVGRENSTDETLVVFLCHLNLHHS